MTTTSAAPRAVSGYVHSETTFGSPVDDVAVMVTITRRAPDHEVHRTADAEHVLPRHGPVRDVAGDRHLERAEHGDVDVPAADHREALRAVEVRGAGQRGHRPLRRVDEVRVELVLARSRPDAEEPVLRVQEDARRLAEQPGDEVRDADAEVDDLARAAAPAPRGPRSRS